MNNEQIDFCLERHGGYITWNGNTGYKLIQWKVYGSTVILFDRQEGTFEEAKIEDLSGSFWHTYHECK
jgi:hypothetical protein